MTDRQPDGLPVPRRYWAAAAVWLAMAVTVIDGSIANLALPAIVPDLHTTPHASIWVINAYQIAITMLLLPIAAIGESLGFRRVYGIGMLVFVAGSIACAMAQTLVGLSLARFVQGAGAACVMAINGAMIRFTYPKAWLGRGIGYNAMVVAIGSAAGPSIAAAILAVANWRWLFAVNVPIGILAVLVGARSLPDPPGSGARVDGRSTMLTMLGFGAAFFVATDFADGRPGVGTAVALVVAIVAAALLVRRARGQASPLVPLDLLRIPILRLSYLTSIFTFAAHTAALVSLPFFLQRRLGFDQLDTGLLITVWPLGMAIGAPLAGRLVERVSIATLGCIGLLVFATGLCGIALAPLDPFDHARLPLLVLSLALCGGGFGLFQAPNNRAMLGTAPVGRSGAAAGMLATARLVGQTTGAVLAATGLRIAGPTSADIFIGGAALALVGAAVSLRRRAAFTARVAAA